MASLVSKEIRLVLVQSFPLDATCWSQATDEVRDICRTARQMVGLDEDHAVNFRIISSPSEWNTLGIERIGEFIDMMKPDVLYEFVSYLKREFTDIFNA